MSEPSRSARTARAWWLALALVVAVAAWFRMHDLSSFRIGPDDGSYLHSARVHQLERGGDPIAWVREDVAWAREIASLYGDERQSYQHSYLHQLATRWLYRMGASATHSLRMSSALLGTLTVLFVAWLVRRLLPAQRGVALLAAAFVAVAPAHVFLSRTGWGQAGFTCWYLAFLVVAHRVLVARPEPSRRGLVLGALGLVVTSVLAYGWHEGVVFFVAGTGLVALAAPWIRGEAWSLRSALASRRTWTYVAGVSVVGAFTVALFFSKFALDYWIHPKGRAQKDDSMSWLELKGRTLENLVVTQRADLWMTWPYLVLASLGAVWLRRTDRSAFRWLAANAIAGALVLYVLFGDAWLLRAYLPTFVIAIVFAACGLGWITERFGHAVAAVTGSIALALLCATTWQSLFGRHLGPLYIQKLYDQANDLDHRHVDERMYELLVRERKEGDRVAVCFDKACIYKLQDRGIRAIEEYMESGEVATWPRWAVASARDFESSRLYVGQGGPYVLRVKDGIGRHALYERKDP